MMTNKRVAILGAGSLGTVIGAVVSERGGECILIDTNEAHVKALNEEGATVTGFMDLKAMPVTAITPAEMSGIYDLVFVLTKQTANEKALTNLLSYLDENSTVCTLQNGIPEEATAAIIGPERTIGGTVGWGAGWVRPGVAELFTKPDHMRIELGSLEGGITDRVKQAGDFLKLVMDIDMKANLAGVRWSKLLMNSALSGMSAALACTFGDVIDDDKGVLCAAYVAKELIEVANAKGIKLEVIVPGYDFYDLHFTDKAGRDRAVAILREMYEVHRPQKASMLQDLEKGIPCEIDYINGVVCEQGDVYGIDTPFNDTIVSIVKAAQAKTAPFPSVDNLSEFDIPAL